VLYVLLRLVRHLSAMRWWRSREPAARDFSGISGRAHKLAVFVISAVVTGLGAGLVAFQNYLVSAEAVSVPFAGELLAMVVIGGMRSMLGPALGALFFILFREIVFDLDPELAALVGLTFVAFVMFSA